MSYDPVRCQQISVLAIAPGAFVDKKYCRSANFYASKNDFVYLLDSKGRKRCTDNLHVLDRHPDAPYFDHSIQSPTFTKPISIHLNEFLEDQNE